MLFTVVKNQCVQIFTAIILHIRVHPEMLVDIVSRFSHTAGTPPLTVLEAACTLGAVKIATEYLQNEEFREVRRRSRNLLHLAFMVRGKATSVQSITHIILHPSCFFSFLDGTVDIA